MAKDPVCGMEVEEETTALRSDYKGKTYYFCCKECKEKFDRDPKKYVREKEAK